LGRPTLETNPEAVWQEFDKISKQLKHGGYMESTLPSGETDVLHYPGYKRSKEHGWVYGIYDELYVCSLYAEVQHVMIMLKEPFGTFLGASVSQGSYYIFVDKTLASFTPHIIH
jgi:hypothetical protein